MANKERWSNKAEVKKDGTAILLDCPCGLNHRIEYDSTKKVFTLTTTGEIKEEDDLQYMFEDEKNGEGEGD